MEISAVRPVECSPVPDPRSGHRCVVDDTNLYVFGGYSPFREGKLFRELWRFNFIRKTWEHVETTGPCPFNVASCCVLLDRGSMIVFGGSGVPFGQSNSDELHVYVLKCKRWTEISTDTERTVQNNASPLAGYGQCMVLSPERDLYVFAGTTGHDFHSHVYRFNFPSRKWSRVLCEEPPFPRYRHEGITFENNLYVIGGGIGSHDPVGYFSLNNIPYLNFNENTWKYQLCQPSRTDGYPSRRRCHGCVLYQSTVYICGGYDGESMFDDIWSLDLKTFHWEKLQKVLPYPVYFHDACVTPAGCMYVFGGVKSMQSETDCRSNDLHKLWLAIPPLVDLCLEKLVGSILPKDFSVESLAKLGFPPHLVNRLV